MHFNSAQLADCGFALADIPREAVDFYDFGRVPARLQLSGLRGHFLAALDAGHAVTLAITAPADRRAPGRDLRFDVVDGPQGAALHLGTLLAAADPYPKADISILVPNTYAGRALAFAQQALRPGWRLMAITEEPFLQGSRAQAWAWTTLRHRRRGGPELLRADALLYNALLTAGRRLSPVVYVAGAERPTVRLMECLRAHLGRPFSPDERRRVGQALAAVGGHEERLEGAYRAIAHASSLRDLGTLAFGTCLAVAFAALPAAHGQAGGGPVVPKAPVLARPRRLA